MPGSGRAEIYFIAAMMFLIIIVCTVTVFFFIKTYKNEMREKAQRDKLKRENAGHDVSNVTSGS